MQTLEQDSRGSSLLTVDASSQSPGGIWHMFLRRETCLLGGGVADNR
jgi:hypothetical protein